MQNIKIISLKLFKNSYMLMRISTLKSHLNLLHTNDDIIHD